MSTYAQHVTILVRSASLAASMSQYLIREIEAAPTSTFATAPRSRAAAAMDAWSNSASGTRTLAIPRESRPTGCSS
jgi:hypothetical protein